MPAGDKSALRVETAIAHGQLQQTAKMFMAMQHPAAELGAMKRNTCRDIHRLRGTAPLLRCCACVQEKRMQ